MVTETMTLIISNIAYSTFIYNEWILFMEIRPNLGLECPDRYINLVLPALFFPSSLHYRKV